MKYDEYTKGGYFFRGGLQGIAQVRASKRAAERAMLFAVMWVTWLHGNEVIFKGRTASMDRVVHNVEGFVSCWFRRG